MSGGLSKMYSQKKTKIKFGLFLGLKKTLLNKNIWPAIADRGPARCVGTGKRHLYQK
jgi:hypothetical protein